MKGKVLFVIIALLMLVFAAYLLRVAFVGDPLENISQVKNLRLTQEGFDIMANWDEVDCRAYDINVNRAGQIMTFPGIKENAFTIRNVTPGERYRITVSARTKKGNICLPVTERVIAAKAEQPISVNLTEYYGFANNDFRLKATAVGDVTFSSDNRDVAEINSDGLVTMKQPGEANIIINATGDDLYDEAERSIPVIVYPETLDAVRKVRVENVNKRKAVISWKQDEMASAYSVLKRNPVTDDYEKIAEVPAEINYYEVDRDDYDYEVKGMAEVAGRNIDGRPSKPVHVRSAAQDSPAYSEVKILREYNEENMDLLAVTEGPEGTLLPQGICATEDRYVVTYVNKGGSKGNLVWYNKDGSYDKTTNADGIGHGNGITYNPYTKLLYVPKTQVHEMSSKLSVFDGVTGQYLKTVDGPEVNSCVAYDVTNNKYYFGKGGTMYVSDDSFKLEKTLKKTVRWFVSQDIGAYNGIILVCTWANRETSTVDLYRISDGAYIGSYSGPAGEIESCTMDDGYLVMLVGMEGPQDRIYRTKERIVIP